MITISLLSIQYCTRDFPGGAAVKTPYEGRTCRVAPPPEKDSTASQSSIFFPVMTDNF